MNGTHQDRAPCDCEAPGRPDRDAFRRFYEAEYPRALRLAYRILGDVQRAEDAVHDSFVAGYMHAAELREVERAGPWFTSIVVRRCLGAARERSVPEVDLAGVAAPGAEGPGFELHQALERALATLPVRQRTVFLLTEVEGLSAVEVARILDLRSGTVRFHRFAARRRLRRSLAAFAPGESET